MIVSVNVNSPIAGDNGKHPGEDYIYRFSSIEFKQVRIPDISTDRKLFWSVRILCDV